MILDATNLIVGRFATIVAKKALLGESIDIVNCEKAIITGRKKEVLDRFRQKRERGIPLKGPYYPKQPDRIVRRAVRGMLPYKKPKGSDAFSRVMCYIGVPVKLKGKELQTIESADAKRLQTQRFITIGEICREIGGKI